MNDYELPEGTDPEIAELFKKPEVLSIVQHINKGVASKNKELLDQLSLTKKDINDLGGIDNIKSKLTAAERLEAERAAKASAEAEGSNDIEAVKKAFQQKLDEANAKLEKHEQERVANKVTSQLVKALDKDADVFEVLEPFLKKRLRTEVEADGSIKVKVLTSEGGPMLTEKGEASVKDLIASFRDDPKFSPLFKADNKAGSGAKSTDGIASLENPFAKNTPHYSPTKQAQLYRADPARARALAASVGFKLYE
jgi:hypothetical protein